MQHCYIWYQCFSNCLLFISLWHFCMISQLTALCGHTVRPSYRGLCFVKLLPTEALNMKIWYKTWIFIRPLYINVIICCFAFFLLRRMMLNCSSCPLDVWLLCLVLFLRTTSTSVAHLAWTHTPYWTRRDASVLSLWTHPSKNTLTPEWPEWYLA